MLSRTEKAAPGAIQALGHVEYYAAQPIGEVLRDAPVETVTQISEIHVSDGIHQ